MPDIRVGEPSSLGNLYVRPNLLALGQVIEGHEHHFDHLSYCTHGSVLVESLDESGAIERSRIIRASDQHNWVLIRAGVRHRITALEEGSRFDCLYAHRTPQGEVVQEYTGWEAAYV